MAKEKKSQGDLKAKSSLYLTPATMHGLKYIAFMDKTSQTDIIEDALTEYIAKWEKKNGPVPPQKA